MQRESWDDNGDISEMLRSFDDAEPRARKMLEQCPSVFITGMFYRDPIDNWTDGRITLLGDAAHPMVPFLAAGAGQSIEDAWTFARVLARRKDDIPGALLEYQQRRLPRTTRIQAGARAAVKLMHEAETQRVRDRNGRWKGMARIDPLAETSWGLAWSYDVVKAVEGPPGEVLNVTGLREGKRLQRPEGQRAFDLWKYAFRPEDVARGHDGLREAYDRFLTTNFPLPEGISAVEDELGDVKAWRVVGAGCAARQCRAAFPRRRLSDRLGQGLAGICQPARGRGRRHLLHRRLSARAGASLSRGDRRCRDGLSCAAGARHSGKLDPRLRRVRPAAVSRSRWYWRCAMPASRLPAAIFAAAPFSDLTLSGPSVKAFNGDDPAANRDLLTFMGASYFQGHEPTDPLVSPLFGDLSGLPPLFVTASQGEVLLSDTTRLAERAEKAGVDVTLRVVEDSVHVYTIFPFLPETRSTMEEVAVWAQRNLRRNDTRTQAAE